MKEKVIETTHSQPEKSQAPEPKSDLPAKQQPLPTPDPSILVFRTDSKY